VYKNVFVQEVTKSKNCRSTYRPLDGLPFARL
jgi:hypothetical protein